MVISGSANPFLSITKSLGILSFIVQIEIVQNLTSNVFSIILKLDNTRVMVFLYTNISILNYMV